MIHKPRLGPDRRGALGILADAPHGLTEPTLLAHGGFDRATLASLISDGLARAQPETVTVGGGRSEVRRIMITDAGRRVLDSE